MNRLQQSLERSRRNTAQTTVLFIDLDYFKKINDSLGHDIGDKLLVESSKRLQQVIRGTDLLARLGGDEFCIVLDGIKNMEDVDMVAQKIVEEIAKPFHIDDNGFSISASVGIATFPVDSSDAVTIMKNADIALYKAKDNGRNTYVFFKDIIS